MAATREDIARWFADGVANENTHLIVVCDTFDWEDFPKYYTGSGANCYAYVQEVVDGKNMQKVMEVYRLSDPLDEQINQFRCFRY